MSSQWLLSFCESKKKKKSIKQTWNAWPLTMYWDWEVRFFFFWRTVSFKYGCFTFQSCVKWANSLDQWFLRKSWETINFILPLHSSGNFSHTRISSLSVLWSSSQCIAGCSTEWADKNQHHSISAGILAHFKWEWLLDMSESEFWLNYL